MARQSRNDEPLAFEDTLWKAADKLRGSMDASEYKHVVLSLVFLKYIDDSFTERREKLAARPPWMQRQGRTLSASPSDRPPTAYRRRPRSTDRLLKARRNPAKGYPSEPTPPGQEADLQGRSA